LPTHLKHTQIKYGEYDDEFFQNNDTRCRSRSNCLMSLDRPFILAVDVGTSALKAVLYDSLGHVLGSATRRYEYRSEKPGWAEGDPEDWWSAFEGALAELQQRGFTLKKLEGISFTGQMHTAVLLDEAGQVLQPTILWLDRRATAETVELEARLQLPPYQINSTYTLPKLLWLKRHRPEVVEKTRTILWPKDYLRYRLTGVLGTDMTEAGGAALMNWENRSWAAERLAIVGLTESVLPPTSAANDVVGPPSRKLADRLGLDPKAKVVVGMGDVAALIGGAPPKPGRVVCSLGSSSMIFMALAEDQQPQDPTHRLYTYPLGPYRLFGGVSSTTGAALVWAYHQIAPGETADYRFEQVTAEAAQLAPGADGLCFIPYLAGERTPYWLDNIKGGFYGLQLSHTRQHLMRAVMESLAYSLRHLLDIYAELGTPVAELILAGGGTKTPGLAQIIADVCQYDVAIYTEAETVTRVLYALCRSALHRADFDETLVSTFPAPDVISCSRDHAAAYQRSYATYRRFAAFALKEATHSEQVISNQ
ncbi:MAG: FGGY family carbohydrate kinase, partial [Chloroflexota bacterium]